MTRQRRSDRSHDKYRVARFEHACPSFDSNDPSRSEVPRLESEAAIERFERDLSCSDQPRGL